LSLFVRRDGIQKLGDLHQIARAARSCHPTKNTQELMEARKAGDALTVAECDGVKGAVTHESRSFFTTLQPWRRQQA
jgi:hypothetical protein